VNLNIGMFLEFPGILVVVGIVLIIIAIVIAIFATKKEEIVEENSQEDDYNVETVKLIDDVENLEEKKEVIAEPVNLIKNNVISTPIDDETILEDVEHEELNPAEEDFLDTKEFVILDNVEKTDNTDVETL